MRESARIIWIIMILFSGPRLLRAQSWGEAADCHINARTADNRFGGRKDVVDATFRWLVHTDGDAAECTGVLMNRDVDQDELGYYFSTARHCLHNDDIDYNAEHEFTFHYQSPSGSTSQVAESNEGRVAGQSVELNPPSGQRGFEYFHTSQVELVNETYTADYALLRMVTPPPPHFNLYFAGWNPSNPGIPQNGTVINDCGQWHAFVLPNHPLGDIKKVNGAAALQNPQTPIYTVLIIVTEVIDLLFGLVGYETSTQVIASYVDVPWYTVEWCDHGIEVGSSGAPLFDPEGRYIGPLSGLGGVPCSGWVPTSIGKFKNAYPFASIKNTLNPSNDFGIDQYGIGGRRIQCYTNLVLPGGHQTTAYYFPASHYQSENRITLRAAGGINVVAPIKILDGANYEFKAGGYIDMNAVDAYVDVSPGATFLAEIEGCTRTAQSYTPEVPEFSFQRLPRRLALELPEAEAPYEEAKFLRAIPNPARGSVAFRTDLMGQIRITLVNSLGGAVLRDQTVVQDLSLQGLAVGIYLVRAEDGNGQIRTTRLLVE